jgi:hypothetical protein
MFSPNIIRFVHAIFLNTRSLLLTSDDSAALIGSPFRSPELDKVAVSHRFAPPRLR